MPEDTKPVAEGQGVASPTPVVDTGSVAKAADPAPAPAVKKEEPKPAVKKVEQKKEQPKPEAMPSIVVTKNQEPAPEKQTVTLCNKQNQKLLLSIFDEAGKAVGVEIEPHGSIEWPKLADYGPDVRAKLKNGPRGRLLTIKS